MESFEIDSENFRSIFPKYFYCLKSKIENLLLKLFFII